MSELDIVDPDIAAAIRGEEWRQWNKLELIASENYTSAAVIEAQGTVLINKYAEGYPGRRYYGGCEWVDVVENIAVQRCKELFGAEHVNVQPYSGTQANVAAYSALVEPGDTVLGLRLDHGGHLTHGSPVNFSGKTYNFVAYGVRKDTEHIDYDQVAQLAKEHKPRLILTGASAYPRTIHFDKFREIADSVGAYFMVDMAHIAGIIAAKLHPDPVAYAHIVTSTTQKTLRGPRGGFIISASDLADKVDKSVFPENQGGPHMHTIAAKAVAFLEAMQPSFKVYQQQILDNAKSLAEELAALGLRIVSGGTDNHIVLVDLSPVGVTGRTAERALDAVGVTVSRSTIPFDPKPPMVASGIRLGTAALTTRGFKQAEMKKVAGFIAQTLHNPSDEVVREEVRKGVSDLCQSGYPVPGIKGVPEPVTLG